ncbi:hypothetical protein A9P79_01235 [Cupriavidus taiwanensis]|uniref:hypothetical protein n=1 Tax=Cupriavidus taiwanensis TaxID=164546 RepID=UPI001F00AD08|nr:hypothetical protein [Cupriavidus taiwanensis]ULX50624.1 hypothetical protein A9P79_01235 [Cupriavidus taiwanensis]
MFSDNHQYSVELQHDKLGCLGRATLTFGGGRAIQVEVDLVNAFPILAPGTAMGTVHARAQDGQTFTLYGCKIHQFVIDASVIVLGTIAGDTQRRISIRFTDISEWLLHWHGISGSIGKALEWSAPFESETVRFESGTQAFTLSTEYVGDLRRSGEDHILHEHIEFVLECQSAGLEAIPARRNDSGHRLPAFDPRAPRIDPHDQGRSCSRSMGTPLLSGLRGHRAQIDNSAVSADVASP